jgi:hypothetical protein
MAETPEERLARLRREVESSWAPPREPDGDALPDVGLATDTTTSASPPGPAATDADAARSQPEITAPPPAHDPAPETAPAPAADRDAEPAPTHEPEPVPTALPPAPVHPAAVAPVQPPPRASAPPAPVQPPPSKPSLRPTAGSDEEGWALADALGGASLGQWIAVGLLVVGGYLFLSQLFPWIGFPGSLVMTAAGLVLLWQHFGHRAGPWALYAGMVLAFIGALRVVGDLLPFNVQGETSLGLGLALLTIAWLRHTQVGGWGWQGIAGVVVLVWGLIQLGLGLLPGAPGLLDLVLPLLLLAGGGWLLVRTVGDRRA